MSNSSGKLLYFLAFLIPVVSASFAAFYTNSIWEDALITLRQAVNWNEGRGLTYNSDEIVHGFTSPLNLLLLALFHKLFGNVEALNAIYAYRILSILILGLCGVLLANLHNRTHPKSTFWSLFAVVLLSLDSKAMLFSINGQEPAFTIFFMLLGIYATQKDNSWYRSSILILSFAGLQWNRPEGFIIATGIMLGDLCSINFQNRIKAAKNYLIIISGSILLYLPWLVFTTKYYGSPIPNTILAKSTGSTDTIFWNKLIPSIVDTMTLVFSPAYTLSSQHPILCLSSTLLTLLGLCCFMLTKDIKLIKIATITASMIFVYLTIIAAKSVVYPWSLSFPWYMPPLSVSLLLALCAFLQNLYASNPNLKKTVKLILPTIILLCSISFYYSGINKARLDQIYVDNLIRKQVGIFLKEHADKNHSVFAECIGYVGFYSQLKIIDYPGLTSTKTVAIRREDNLDFFGTLQASNADWLVLRQNEYIASIQKNIINQYKLVKVFELPLDSNIPEEVIAGNDSKFYILTKIATRN